MMTATVTNGVIVPHGSLDQFEGKTVTIRLAEETVPGEEDDPLGIFGDDEASIARWIAMVDAAPVLEFTDEERVDRENWRKKIREYDLLKQELKNDEQDGFWK